MTIYSLVSAALCAAAALLCTNVARADENQSSGTQPSEFAVVLGTKLWANTWSSWSLRSVNSNGGSLLLIDPAPSGSSTSVIPQLSVRYRDYLASMSIMAPTRYQLDQQWGVKEPASRSEIDANVGGYVTTGLAVTLGYKRLMQDFGGRFSWAGPTLGASATGTLSPTLSSYMGLGLGIMKARLAQADGAGKVSLPATYVVSEAGLAYSPARGNAGWRSKVVLTAGYRSQVMTTKGYALSDSGGTSSTTTQDVRDSTQGFTLGAVFAF